MIPSVTSSGMRGSPGVNAGVTFNIDAPNKQYWIEVDEVAGLGSYTVKIDTQPGTFFLYYPEGYANSAIREYVAIGNANDYPVSYTVRLKYEDSSIPDDVITRVIPAHSRGGETISDGTPNPGSGVVFNKPYAMIIESDQALLDRGIALYRNRPDKDWSLTDRGCHSCWLSPE